MIIILEFHWSHHFCTTLCLLCSAALISTACPRKRWASTSGGKFTCIVGPQCRWAMKWWHICVWWYKTIAIGMICPNPKNSLRQWCKKIFISKNLEIHRIFMDFTGLEVLTLGGWNPQTKFLKKWMPWNEKHISNTNIGYSWLLWCWHSMVILSISN